MPPPLLFHEASLLSTPIRDLGLTIAGTPLEPVLAQFHKELEDCGIRRLQPHFYLSTEWGVPFGTISIAIPFYLARQDLIAIHAERTGHLEGVGRADLLRYLRHEMGHVVNYAYKLYEQMDWIRQFGPITRPYEENFRPEPFSRRYVRHLPGWYAQKHPDEDWAETFAIWLTPHFDWHALYGDWPEAKAKLDYCDQTMAVLKDRVPEVTATEAHEDVSDLPGSLEDYYRAEAGLDDHSFPPGLDGALQAAFESFTEPAELAPNNPCSPAADLIFHYERELVTNVYRWTGHLPELTLRLVRHLEQRARQLNIVYPASREAGALVAVTTLVTSLAMNHVCRGSYAP
jgi:hypothetical protein